METVGILTTLAQLVLGCGTNEDIAIAVLVCLDGFLHALSFDGCSVSIVYSVIPIFIYCLRQ